MRAQSKDAKFIGSSMGGAKITIKNAETGELLATGETTGSTGDTGTLMQTPKERYMKLSTPGAAKFETSLEIQEPVFVTISATAPYAQRQSQVEVSTQLWLIPGKDISGDGIILEIPGFAVDVLNPQAHEVTSENGISIKANIVMMCGCPTSPGGMWDSSEYDINALVKQDGQLIETIPLNFTGKTSTFEATFTPPESGAYEITVYAYHDQTGNTGLDKTTVIYRGD
ncbi:MAG: hypothetical protein U5K69_18380 [Balneolaceae bacterium]|nr:hypothetical protein [Balneolaceae bacterium]